MSEIDWLNSVFQNSIENMKISTDWRKIKGINYMPSKIILETSVQLEQKPERTIEEQ